MSWQQRPFLSRRVNTLLASQARQRRWMPMRANNPRHCEHNAADREREEHRREMEDTRRIALLDGVEDRAIPGIQWAASCPARTRRPVFA
ncbi:hypothetical protein XH87_06195 [Bradyrhizobium sp. CCBAU 53415]|nr:hypothetical protein [Bradyrhizobium sp. CCBAU 53415]